MKKAFGLSIIAVACVISAIITLLCSWIICPAQAAGVSADYPAVLLRISTYDNSRHMNISGYDDKSEVVASELKNSLNESWRFDYVSTDNNGSFYRINPAFVLNSAIF